MNQFQVGQEVLVKQFPRTDRSHYSGSKYHLRPWEVKPNYRIEKAMMPSPILREKRLNSLGFMEWQPKIVEQEIKVPVPKMPFKTPSNSLTGTVVKFRKKSGRVEVMMSTGFIELFKPSSLRAAQNLSAPVEEQVASSVDNEVGRTVTWKSQANGNWKEKKGTVVIVVPANTKPMDCDLHLIKPTYRNIKFKVDSVRKHESYIVKSDNILYWPVASALVWELTV